jgi:hypothetical protein
LPSRRPADRIRIRSSGRFKNNEARLCVRESVLKSTQSIDLYSILIVITNAQQKD